MFTPYMATYEPEAVAKLADVRKAIELIPDMALPSGNLLSCHIVCRILSQLLHIPFKDGYFKPMCEHSWLEYPRYIVDAYPIGVLNGPLIITVGYGLVWRKLYCEGPLKVVTTEEFKKDLEYALTIVRTNSASQKDFMLMSLLN